MKFKIITKTVFVPLIVASAIFMVGRPVFAQLVKDDIEFAQQAAVGDLQVGVESVNGFSQIYYVRDGQKVFITDSGLNSRQPSSEGEYITYVTSLDGAGQVFLYNVITGNKTQLTNSRINLNPKVSREGRVVWERWVDNTWQIALFDGTTTRRLTDGELSLNPDIEGEYVVFSRKSNDGVWRAVGYSIPQDKAIVLGVGIESKFPKLRNGDIVLDKSGGGESIEPLTIEQLMLISSGKTEENLKDIITANDIQKEINAQPIEEEIKGE